MFASLLEVRNLVSTLCLPDGVRVWLLDHAILAGDNGGYVCYGAPDVPGDCELPDTVLRQDSDGRWYFPPIRAAARIKTKHRRHDQKRRNPTKKSESDQKAAAVARKYSSELLRKKRKRLGAEIEGVQGGKERGKERGKKPN